MLTVTAMFRSASRLTSLALLPLCLLLFSCSTQRSPQFAIPAGKQGLVHGGQQPVTGATIQLYAVGTTADGSASTPLLSPAVVTDANGGFSISAYTCPSPSSLVYIVANGGNPGLFAGTNNSALFLMAALGPCGNLTPSTFIFIDELTTVAAVYSLAPFMTSPSAIGSAPTDATALADAFTLASELANATTGTTPGTGVPPGTTVPVTQINTIADIVAACVNSPGGVAGDNSTCGTLFSLTTLPGTTPPTDTITALLHLANNPSLNTASLYGLITPTSPFQPIQPQTPPDLSVRLTVPSGFTVSTTVLNFPATRLYTTSAPLTVTLTNNTAAPVGIDIGGFSAAFSGADPDDFTFANSLGQGCSAPVMPGTSCTLAFTFRTTDIGTRSAYFNLLNSSANPAIPILMTAVGLEASGGQAGFTSSPLSFTAAGTPGNATLTNYGPAPLTIDSVTISNDPTSGQPAFTQTNNCGTSLASQASCTVTVTALSTTQPYSTGVLTVGDDSVSGAATLNLSYSNGFSGPLLFNFGSRSIGTQGMGGVSFQPPGIPPGGTYTITLTGPDATDFSFLPGSSSQSTTCAASRLSPNCGLAVYFNPSALGLRLAELNINGTPYGGFVGTGLSPGIHFSASSSSINFPPVPIGKSLSLLGIGITNTGTVPIIWNAPVLSGPNASEFSVPSSTCTTLAPNATCMLNFTASPTQLGTRIATVTLTDSTATALQTVALTVIGGNPSPVAAPTELDFPYTPLGTISASQSFTVTSFNNDPVFIQVVDSASSPFVITQGSSCSKTPCQVSVIFAPTAANIAPADGNNSYDQILITDLFSSVAAAVNVTGINQTNQSESRRIPSRRP
jgi:trimeric autotransporter adhesin